MSSTDQPPQDEEIKYAAGTCNIGPNEIRRRQLVATFGVFFTISALFTFHTQHVHGFSRFSIFFPALVFAIGYLQMRRKFCMAYGLAGTFNMGKMGAISKVQSAEDRATDRKTAIRILYQAVLIAAGIAIVALLLPI